MLRHLFADQVAPSMPGVVLFRTFSTWESVVYVPLGDCNTVLDVRQRIRNVFGIATQAIVKLPSGPLHDDAFANAIDHSLQKEKISYVRTGTKSMAEWLTKAYQTAWDHGSDLVTLAGLFGLG